MEIASKITLLFASIGALAGCISAPIESTRAALLIAILFFCISYKLTPNVLRIPITEIPGGKKGILTTGFWPFFIMWLVFWIMVYTTLLG